MLLFHGGGHFGDLYAEHQDFRESLFQLYPQRRIVSLPQTLCYSDDSAIARSAQVLEAHPNPHWRDRRSLESLYERGALPHHGHGELPDSYR